MKLTHTELVDEALDDVDNDVCDGCADCAPELFGVEHVEVERLTVKLSTTGRSAESESPGQSPLPT